MRRSVLLISFLLFCLVGLGLVQAQNNTADPEDCIALVQQAYDVTQDACQGVGRDELCYGNSRIDIVPDGLVFNQTGDIAPVAEIESLRLSPMNVESGEWGVSLMRVQASLPDDDALENVDLLLFGNISLSQNIEAAASAVAPTALPQITIEITAAGNINVRSIPSTSGAVIGVLDAGTVILADGRNSAGDWVRVNLSNDPAPALYGWVFTSLFTVNGDVSTLPIVEAGDTPAEEPTVEAAVPAYGPMQAFYFTSGTEDRPCAEAPDSGLLIQTPSGVGLISFLINEVTIELGSTGYIQMAPGDEMRISVLEGNGRVTVGEDTVMAPASTYVTVPLDSNGLASGAPSDPQPYDASAFGLLPLASLSRPITIADQLNHAPVILSIAPIIPPGVDCPGEVAIMEFFDPDGDAVTYSYRAETSDDFYGDQVLEQDGLGLLGAAVFLTDPYVVGHPEIPEAQMSSTFSYLSISRADLTTVTVTLTDAQGNASTPFTAQYLGACDWYGPDTQWQPRR